MRHRATLQNLLKILQSQNIPLLHWPGNSPDMNPIENMWEVKAENIITKSELIETLIRV